METLSNRREFIAGVTGRGLQIGAVIETNRPIVKKIRALTDLAAGLIDGHYYPNLGKPWTNEQLTDFTREIETSGADIPILTFDVNAGLESDIYASCKFFIDETGPTYFTASGKDVKEPGVDLYKLKIAKIAYDAGTGEWKDVGNPTHTPLIPLTNGPVANPYTVQLGNLDPGYYNASLHMLEPWDYPASSAAPGEVTSLHVSQGRTGSIREKIDGFSPYIIPIDYNGTELKILNMVAPFSNTDLRHTCILDFGAVLCQEGVLFLAAMPTEDISLDENHAFWKTVLRVGKGINRIGRIFGQNNDIINTHIDLLKNSTTTADIDPATGVRMMRDGKPARLTDMEPGQEVVFLYQNFGDHMKEDPTPALIGSHPIEQNVSPHNTMSRGDTRVVSEGAPVYCPRPRIYTNSFETNSIGKTGYDKYVALYENRVRDLNDPRYRTYMQGMVGKE